MSISLHTVFTADAHLAEALSLREAPTVNKGKSLKFREGTRKSTEIINIQLKRNKLKQNKIQIINVNTYLH
jgi:hypothetical protein